MKDKCLKFRLDAVKSWVNELVTIFYNNQTKISAAFFYYPKMARRIFLQNWAFWNIDLVRPMNYHHSYNEDTDWINFIVENGINETKDKFDYYSGIFVGALNPQKFKEAIIGSIDAGANIIVFLV